MNKQELKSFLDFKSQHYESEFFIAHDPIQIPHQFSKKEDIEIAGFLTATIAWGNRVSILKSSQKLVRGNSEWRERGNVWSFKAMFENSTLEGQRPMPWGMVCQD